MAKYLIKNCDVADFDTLTTTRADIRIDGEYICAVAPSLPSAADETVMDAQGMLAMPAFVDAHTHMNQTFLKGPMDDFPITEWLVRMIRYEDSMDEETCYYSTLLGCLSSLRFGTTTINEMSDWQRLDPVLQAIEDSGIRATFGISTTDVPENDITPIISIDEALKRSEFVCDKIRRCKSGLIRPSVAPAGLPAVSGEMAKALKNFANQQGIVYHTHLGEGRTETANVAKAYKVSGECEALYNLGILDENTLLAHSIWLQDFELELIKESGASPVHCPNTNMKISDGIPKIAQMLALGINVAIGCDGEASSSTRDMIREGRAGAYLQKVTTLDPTVMDAGTTFKMMTRNGARALGYKDLGELKVGKRADLILVNCDELSLVNPEYRIGNLLYAGDGYAVDTVFCNGSPVLLHKKLSRFDEAEMIAKCRECVSALNKKLGL